MRDFRRISIVATFLTTLLAISADSAQAAQPVITNVTIDVNQTQLYIYGQNLCSSPTPEVLMFLPPNVGVSMPLTVTSASPTRITVTKPSGDPGVYFFALKCGPAAADFHYFFAAFDPAAPANGVATLGANTFTGSQTITGGLHVTADVVVDGNIGAKYQDVAEWVDTSEPLTAGTVVVIDAHAPNRVVAATRAYATTVAGAVSAQPGIILGEPGVGRVQVAQSGRVRIKADAQYGAIKTGDLLVSSPTKGYAMRSSPIRVGGERMHRPGTILGKALEALPSGRREILVLLTLQ